MTEPRRIAAISSAERIRYELSMEEPLVAHHIRYECKTTEETKIAVMTDGVLLNEVSSDFLLQKYSGLFYQIFCFYTTLFLSHKPRYDSESFPRRNFEFLVKQKSDFNRRSP